MSSTTGAYLGVSGIEHGVGDVLQGNVAPPAMVFGSWPGSDFFRIFNGEPAFSLVPNLLVTGILTIVVSALAAPRRITDRGAFHCTSIMTSSWSLGHFR